MEGICYLLIKNSVCVRFFIVSCGKGYGKEKCYVYYCFFWYCNYKYCLIDKWLGFDL